MQGCDGGKDAYSDKPQVGRARGIVTRRGGEGEEIGEGGNQGYSDGERGEGGCLRYSEEGRGGCCKEYDKRGGSLSYIYTGPGHHTFIV